MKYIYVLPGGREPTPSSVADHIAGSSPRAVNKMLGAWAIKSATFSCWGEDGSSVSTHSQAEGRRTSRGEGVTADLWVEKY